MGAVDWGWWPASINLCHPAAANWAALLEHLTDPLAHPDHLTESVKVLRHISVRSLLKFSRRSRQPSTNLSRGPKINRTTCCRGSGG